MIEAAIAMTKIVELNRGKTIKVKDKYPVLKTRKRNVENLWNSLDFSGKMEIGYAAIHYHLMTANYRWMCHESSKFSDLSNRQQKMVRFVFSKRNDNFYMFDLFGLLKI